jgi:hypothetical protein
LLKDIEMTDTLDTGEIARRIPASVTARIYQPDPPTEIIPGVPAQFYEGPILDLRPPRPAHLGHVHRYLPGALDDKPYPPVPPPVPPQPQKTLADELLGERFKPVTQPEPTPPPPPPPAPRPSWAQRGSAGEWPVVKPLLGRGARRRPLSGLTWALIGSGVTVLVLAAAVGVSALLGVQW